jgi:hypothetical protein
MVKVDSRLHLRNFLRGIEASIVIFISIIVYDFLKEYEVKHIRNYFIPEKYSKIISKFLHFFAIFITEVIVVYILIFIFGVEF